MSTLWLFLDILHCFREERESLLGIKSKLLQLGTELLGMTLATVMFVTAMFPDPAVWLLSKESEFLYTLNSKPVWGLH